MSADRPGTTGTRRGLAGRVLGDRYRVVRMVSAGTYTLIADAEDIELDRPVTVKLVRPELAESAEFRRRFTSEMRTMSSLSHPNIAAVHDWGEETGRQAHDGVRRRRVPRRGQPARPLRPRPLPRPVAGADGRTGGLPGLDFAHRKGLVHTELTPAKLVFGDDRRLRIVDFGLARLLGEHDWSEPATVATHVARYSSPGAGARPADRRQDRRVLAGPRPRRGGHRDGAVRGPLDGGHAVGSHRTADAGVGRSRTAGLGAGEGRPPEPADRSTAAEFGRALVRTAEKLPRPKPIPLLVTGPFRRRAGCAGRTTRPGDHPSGPGRRTRRASYRRCRHRNSPSQGTGPSDARGGRARCRRGGGDDPPAAGPRRWRPLRPPPATTSRCRRGDRSRRRQPAAAELRRHRPRRCPRRRRRRVAAALRRRRRPHRRRAGRPRQAERATAAAEAAPSDGRLPPPPSRAGDPGRSASAGRPWTTVGRRRRWPAWLAGILVVVALAGLGYLAYRLFRPPPTRCRSSSASTRRRPRRRRPTSTGSSRSRRSAATNTGARRDHPHGASGRREPRRRRAVPHRGQRGPELRTLPDLAGQPLNEAETRLAELRLVALPATQQFDETVPVGSVVSWSVPADPSLVAGDEVLPETEVALVVSDGPAPRRSRRSSGDRRRCDGAARGDAARRDHRRARVQRRHPDRQRGVDHAGRRRRYRGLDGDASCRPRASISSSMPDLSGQTLDQPAPRSPRRGSTSAPCSARPRALRAATVAGDPADPGEQLASGTGSISSFL